MFPFMAQGHIIPFLALAFQLIKTNKYTITFVNTHKNINKLRSSLPPNSSFNLLEIPFNSSDHNLPPDTENTDSVPYNMAPNLIEATLSFKPHFRKLVSDLVSEENGQRKPLCIITDMFFGWCAEIAQEFGVFHAIFIGGGGFGFACYYSLWMNLPHRNNTDSDGFFLLPDFPESSRLHVTQLTDYLRVADHGMVLKKVLSPWKNVDGILVNTVEELDNIGLMYFRREIGRQVWPIGPVLLSTGSEARAGKELGISQDVCKNWLDSKPCSSVLYVSFGSQNTIAPSQMMELALALEASGKDFIWVVRPPVGFDINSEFKANDHCGWNSVLEALSHGVPIIGWPMAAKQFYNVKLLEKKMGVYVEVARGKSCQVKHEEIVKIIELVMNETEKGMEMRRRACEIKEIIENAIKDEVNNKGSSTKAMDEFFNAVLTIRESKMG
ncbi:hypothetical protein JRO89_XS10G0031400 [Xanthoceras sorbifolium]|uniref:Uncharacterized protein n=1 Tax=Xanthoceras sorbifolium TaxID=99658 RepID=A0ABQ8HHK1_9ROSI|nr:hypothetical protein JRO89_XS10G0031400 [Xanthoceras sorbifolium]